MSKSLDNLTSKLALFGLSNEESNVFVSLIQNGISTPLRLSRELKKPRTRIYRLLESLIEKGLVKEIVKGYGSKYVAEDPSKFNLIIEEKITEIDLLKKQSSLMVNQLKDLQTETKSTYKIQHYQGIEGLKQVTWNSLKTEGILRIYEIDLMHAFLPHEFSEKVRFEFGRKKDFKTHQLTNVTKFDDYTKVTAHVDQWEVKHIDKEVLPIDVEVLIYNDVYCMYEYKNDDIFIVEITNQKLANMQKKIFDEIWKQAKEMKKTSKFGAAKIV